MFRNQTLQRQQLGRSTYMNLKGLQMQLWKYGAPVPLIAWDTIGSATLLTAPTYGRTVALP